MTITAVGVRLIGGSLIFELSGRGFDDRIIGVDTNQHHRKIAQLWGYIDEHDTLEKEKEAKNILKLAGGGFESTVRLANSNGDTWAPIFLDNAEHVLEIPDTYIAKTQEFKRLISNKDSKELKDLMEKANRISAILN